MLYSIENANKILKHYTRDGKCIDPQFVMLPDVKYGMIQRIKFSGLFNFPNSPENINPDNNGNYSYHTPTNCIDGLRYNRAYSRLLSDITKIQVKSKWYPVKNVNVIVDSENREQVIIEIDDKYFRKKRLKSLLKDI